MITLRALLRGLKVGEHIPQLIKKTLDWMRVKKTKEIKGISATKALSFPNISSEYVFLRWYTRSCSLVNGWNLSVRDLAINSDE